MQKNAYEEWEGDKDVLDVLVEVQEKCHKGGRWLDEIFAEANEKLPPENRIKEDIIFLFKEVRKHVDPSSGPND
tara:strand:- start:1013 stop:1234 length:222 start_codon:yes stop_codon:yes gene_type:complete